MDLILLAIDDRHGVIRHQRLLAAGLAAADLVELAMTGHVVLDGMHLAVREGELAAPQDELLKASLADLAAEQRPTTVADWVESFRTREIGRRYLARLERTGVVGEKETLHGSTLHVTDRALAEAAAERFRSAAHAAVPADMDMAEVALAALADAIDLTGVYLGGRKNKHARERLSELTARRTGTVPEPDHTVLAILRFAVRAIKELPQLKEYSGGGTGSGGIPVNQQWAVKNAGTIVAWGNPNIP